MQPSQRNRAVKEDDEKDNPALSKVIERNIRRSSISAQRLRVNAACKHVSLMPSVLFGTGDFCHENSEPADLEMETKPEAVLAEIHCLPAIELGKR